MRKSRCPRCAAEDARAFHPGSPADRPLVTTPTAAAEVVTPLLEGLDREHCLLVSLDGRSRLLAITTVSVGSSEHTFMGPREVFRDALAAGASAVFLAHNHPSGDDSPSPQDRQITRRLMQAGRVLGIDVVDHLIVGVGTWTSLAASGELQPAHRHQSR